MSGRVIFLLAFAAQLVGVVLGYLSLPRRSVGPASADRRRALAFVAAFLLLVPGIASYVWLSSVVPGWPEDYGTTCRGRGCFVDQLAVSPGLLAGGWRELGLFATLWFWPMLLVAAVVRAAVTRTGIFEPRAR